MRTAEPSVRRPVFGRLYPMMARGMAAGGMGERHQPLLAGLAGRLLEVGPGDRATFVHYPPAVEQVLAIEPEPHLRALAKSVAATAPVSVEVRAGTGDQLPAADARMDAVVFSMVRCSVTYQQTAIAEAVRVSRPGGQIRFLEHVRADTLCLAGLQDVLDATIWPRLMGGCHTARDTLATLERAGLHIHRLERFLFPQMRTPVSFYVLGTAVMAAAE